MEILNRNRIPNIRDTWPKKPNRIPNMINIIYVYNFCSIAKIAVTFFFILHNQQKVRLLIGIGNVVPMFNG